VEEHLHIRNGRHVPDLKEYFDWGDSRTGPLVDGVQYLQRDLLYGVRDVFCALLVQLSVEVGGRLHIVVTQTTLA
jgi:hypothetical protein